MCLPAISPPPLPPFNMALSVVTEVEALQLNWFNILYNKYIYRFLYCGCFLASYFIGINYDNH